jgi:DNA invertase Pin-like site-specific DNA recombinase
LAVVRFVGQDRNGSQPIGEKGVIKMENNITKRAVIYARYSSDKQTEQSIEGQVKVCREFADKMKISIIGEYIDRAMTGTNDNRPEFQRMLADSKNGLFNMILVYKLDRFSRDKYESVVHKRNLKNNGVKVQSATEMISDSPEGILLESVIEGYNQFYSAELSQKIKRGNRMNIEKGLWTGGNLTYGYKVIDKKVHIDEPKAEIVRKIFTNYANGKTKQEICKELNAMGIKTGAGLIWRVNSLQTVFMSNKKYTGIVEKQGEIFDNIYPRIIDNITFDRVQTMLAKKKKLSAKGKAKVEYELTGKYPN